MDDAAIVAGLVGGQDVFFLEHDEFHMGMAGKQFARGRQADDAAADDCDVVGHMCPILARAPAARYGKSRRKAARQASNGESPGELGGASARAKSASAPSRFPEGRTT